MEIKLYCTMSEFAARVRQTVFVEEQGFQEEFDAIDDVAVHFVMFDGEKPIATCRLFRTDGADDTYTLGRYAILREYRGRSLGREMMEQVEKHVHSVKGKEIILHAQCRVSGFYERLGFIPYGETDEEEGCPPIWMKTA